MDSPRAYSIRRLRSQAGASFLDYSFILLLAACSIFNVVAIIGPLSAAPLEATTTALDGGGSDSTSTVPGPGGE